MVLMNMYEMILAAAPAITEAATEVVAEVAHDEGFIHGLLTLIIPVISGTLELIGVGIITIGSLRALIAFIGSKFNFGDEEVKLQLAQSLALSLEFKLGAEILKSVIVRDVEEFILLFAIVVLRVILTFVIHWEIKTTHEDKKMKVRELEMAIKQDKRDQGR